MMWYTTEFENTILEGDIEIDESLFSHQSMKLTENHFILYIHFAYDQILARTRHDTQMWVVGFI
jgi:hypothetical protein